MSSEYNRQPSPYAQQGDTGTGGPAAPTTSTAEGAPQSPALGATTTPAGAVPRVPNPSIDLIENTDELWLFIDLPGFQPKEIQLEGDARTIHVSASRPSEIENGRNVLKNERSFQVERTIQLPVAVDVEEVEATFEQGVCKLTIPKAASERYRDIEIRSTG